jgi:hypothetical protein
MTAGAKLAAGGGASSCPYRAGHSVVRSLSAASLGVHLGAHSIF